MKEVDISIICPIFNEEKYIEKLISFYENSYPKNKELFLVDGGSIDKTKELVVNLIKAKGSIHLFDNPLRYVPFALNKVIPMCKGSIIIRLDAHTEYESNYISKIIETFEKTDADIVGGPMRPVGLTPFQKGVAIATSNKFGVGNSHFHDVNYEGYVDSVYLGAWKKELFDDVGLFDETLYRNQDDEFHYRAKSIGKKIYLNPEIKSYYYPRSSPKKLSIQYFQYGLYKPKVLNKIKSETKIRHLIPSMFVIYLILFIILFSFIDLFFIPLLTYISICLFNSFSIKEKWNTVLSTFFAYPVIHFSYGLGFIIGLFRRI